ncbi:poly(ADP-ribose) glycohydrolase 1-like [Brassica napus]|nr:poly(ADP-ribose) glycohydrolase 1-like [Brassica napus]
MESRDDLNSILPYLPLLIRSSSLYWPPRVVEALKAMSEGPSHSRVDSGEVLWQAISDMRQSLSLSARLLSPSAPQGYALLFDELIHGRESKRWFDEIIPALARLLLQLPSLLEMHFQKADDVVSGVKTGLRLLAPQQAGVVFLSQELIGALLACGFFCLFPVSNRGAKDLSVINFDNLFASLYESYSESHESKIRCIMHYFERVCSCMPTGTVSFERKILPAEYPNSSTTAPDADFWSKSDISLCAFKVHSSGLIEDQSDNALEVDFANKYLGGGSLNRGCVQEEIRFMINPELIAGMLFLPRMDDNEAIEIVGAERFSCYTGYASSFRFAGDYIDKKTVDAFKRRRTRIVAIDALCAPKMRHFKDICLLREINKALCGFLIQRKSWQHQNKGDNEIQLASNDEDSGLLHTETSTSHGAALDDAETNRQKQASNFVRDVEGSDCMDHEAVGVATGNWGCGVFGGDPELKAMIQWLAASRTSSFSPSGGRNLSQKRFAYSFQDQARSENPKMESRDDLNSILPYLPLLIRSSSLYWPPRVVEALKAMSEGPSHSRVDSGEVLWQAISDMRQSLSLSARLLSPSAPQGYALLFDELIHGRESKRWFDEIIPALARLLLQLPSLLEMHFQKADDVVSGVKTGLRLLAPQQAGVVFLSQELIGALLACGFFCLFPVSNRGAKDLSVINFDNLFASLYESYSESHESKIRCIMHYFERVCSCMPTGTVSFERKILPAEYPNSSTTAPDADFWSKSDISLCAFKVHSSGLIEDQSDNALEVDFANKYLGGGSLNRGCVQEEIRFMINPELIAGMLFLPRMDDNEAIEIVGAERFSCYTGYASSFRFAGDYIDKKTVDAFKRRRTRIVAIDALCAPKMRHFKDICLLREINKALCGFLIQRKSWQHQNKGDNEIQLASNDEDSGLLHTETSTSHGAALDDAETNRQKQASNFVRDVEGSDCMDHEAVGVATGNWGCGVFGGDPELKAMIQWLAASRARRPFISYYTFGAQALENLDQVTKWILSHDWTVGDLWNMMLEYSAQRLYKQTHLGFFSWLLPSLCSNNEAI